MATKIRNVARHLVIVPLNSGMSLHLAPCEESAGVDDLELNGNAKVDKLIRSGMIQVRQEVSQGAPAPPSKKPGAKAQKQD